MRNTDIRANGVHARATLPNVNGPCQVGPLASIAFAAAASAAWAPLRGAEARGDSAGLICPGPARGAASAGVGSVTPGSGGMIVFGCQKRRKIAVMISEKMPPPMSVIVHIVSLI